ncbi:MAG: hypothetical protein ABI716_03515 [Candidatus Saccharibacteria bacterium]
MDSTQNIQSYAYYRAVEACIAGNKLNVNISSTYTSPSQWFDPQTVAVGYFIDSQDGQRDCSNLIGGALSLWGYTPATFLSAMGYKLSGTGTEWKFGWKNGSPIDALQAAFSATIAKTVYAGSSPSLTAGAAYKMLLGTFSSANACAAKDKMLYTGDMSNPYQKMAKSNENNGTTQYTIVTIFSETTNNLEKRVFEVPLAPPGTPWLYASGTGGNATAVYASCDVKLTTPGKISAAASVLFNQYVNKAASLLKAKLASSGLRERYTNNCQKHKTGDPCDELQKAWDNFLIDCAKPNLGKDGTAYESAIATCMAGKTGISVNLFIDALVGVGKPAAPDVTATPGDSKVPKTTSSCTVDGIGWIVCPVLKFMGTITDSAFNFLAGNFLETKADVVADPTTQNAWSLMRNFANVAFVIAFLIIIFSQMTSVGITNYGVKKMLPRLVIAAILVNLSFVICQIAVDISNILGYSLKSMFDNLQSFTLSPTTVGESTETNGWQVAGLVGGAVAGGTAMLLAVTVPVLMAALLALMLIVLILFGRTALIILLVIVSPLAFVAYLLPNTEQWFKKWYKMFASLLLVFPLIAIVVGASGLAAGILNKAAGGDKMLQVVAIGVATIPLFIVPSLLKNSLSAAGAIGAKLAGYSSKANSQIGGKVKSTSRLGEAMQNREISGIRNRAKRRANPNGWQSSLDNSRIGRRMGFDRGARSANQISDKAFEEEVSAADISQKNFSSEDIESAALVGKVGGSLKKDSAGNLIRDAQGKAQYDGGRTISNAEKTAAVRNMMKVGNSNQRRELYTESGNGSEQVKQSMRDGYFANNDNLVYGPGRGDEILQGTLNNEQQLDDALAQRAEGEGFSAETLAKDSRITTHIARIAMAGGTAGHTISRAKLDSLRDAGTEARLGASTSGKVTGGMISPIADIEAL